MKIIYILIATFLSCFINAQTTLIPNSTFEQILINQGIDSDGLVNGMILTSDALEVTELIINSNSGQIFNITDLTGIEAFINLKTLYITDAYLFNSGINLSALINLEDLKLNNCHLQSINLTTNTFLKSVNFGNHGLDTGGNLFNSLDLSNNPLINSIGLYNHPVRQINLKNNIQPNLLIELSVEWLNLLTNNVTICIDVDDAIKASNQEGVYENWQINGPISNISELYNYSFSENCILNNSENNKIDFLIYPNPTTDFIHLNYDETQIHIKEISIFSIDGKKVKNLKIESKLNIEDIPMGSYLLKIISNKGNFSKKIIKK